MINQSVRKGNKMPYPDFIKAFPSIDVPFPDDVVQTAVVQSDNGLVGVVRQSLTRLKVPRSHKSMKRRFETTQ